MIILVTASRFCRPEDHRLIIRRTLAWAAGFRDGVIDPDHELWDGRAVGGDEICNSVAVEDFGWKERRFAANWHSCVAERVPDCEPCTPAHRRPRRGGGDYCPTAGFRRNQTMVDMLAREPGRKVCVAFPIPGPHPYGSHGTFDCLLRAARAGIFTNINPLRPPTTGRTS